MPSQHRTPPERSRTRDAEVRRVSRITRSVAALAVAGVAQGGGLAAASHQTGGTAATAPLTSSALQSADDTGAGATAATPSASSAAPVTVSGAS